MKPTSNALRYLKSKGWSMAATVQAVKDSGLTAVEIADKLRAQEGDIG